MKVLMISIDRALIGERTATTDAVFRHRMYAQQTEGLHIIVFSASGYQAEELSEKCFVYPTNSASKIRYFSDAFRIAKDIIKGENIDLIVAQHYAAPIAQLLRRKFDIPYVVSLHGADLRKEVWGDRLIGRLYVKSIEHALRKADAVRVVSPAVATMLKKMNIKRKNIHIIPTPIDLKKFAAAHPERVDDIKLRFGGKQIILFTGRLEPIKNIPMLLQAFEKVVKSYHHTQLVIIGNGSEEKSLKELTKKLELEDSVTFTGGMSSDELPNYYHAANIYALPSDSESLGKVLIEAGMAGCPVVATKTPGAKYIVRHEETGLLVPVGNEQKFADALTRLLEDIECAEKLGKAAPNVLKKRFDLETNVSKIVKMWKDIYETYNDYKKN